MKAVLLAAGKGRRLKGITKTIPKPMLKVRNKPILQHNIEWLRSYGIRDVYINLHHLPEVIMEYFKDGSQHGIRITYSYEKILLGTAGAVKKISETYWKRGKSPFLVIYGDNLLNFDLKKIIRFHRIKRGKATIALYQKGNVSQSGIVQLDKNGRVMKFIEKPQPEEAVSDLVNTGIYVLERDILKYIPDNEVFDFGNDLFPIALENGEKIFGILVRGKLIAVDTPELLNICQSVN